MDEKKLFNVVLVGEIKEGFDKNVVISSLATLFKLPLEKAETLLNGQLLVVKSSVDTATADKYKVAIERAGVCCRLEAVPAELPLEFDFTKEPLGTKNTAPTAKLSAPKAKETAPYQNNPSHVPLAKKALAETGNINTAAMWNPSSAASWSVLFSPVFGSYLHAMNWRTLNEQERYSKAMIWCYVGIAVLVASVFLSKGGAALNFWYLIIWYFAAARSQAKYVKERFGNNYPRQAWGKPLCIAGASLMAFCIVVVVLQG